MNDSNNKYGQVWDEDNARGYFLDALKYAEDNKECLSLQDAIYHCGMAYSTFYYLSDRYAGLETIKKDIHNAVIRRVNKGALTGDMNPTAGIWRMKQSGEVDSRDLNNNHSGRIDGTQEHKVTFQDYEDDKDS